MYLFLLYLFVPLQSLSAPSAVSYLETGVAYDGDEHLFASIFDSFDVEAVVEGLVWSEGPVYSVRQRSVYVSDTISNAIYRYDESSAEVEAVVENSGGASDSPFQEPGSNGMHIVRDDELGKGPLVYVCRHGNRSISVLDVGSGAMHALVSATEAGNRLNSPNDLVVTPDGKYVIFTDPTYGLINKGGHDVPEVIEKSDYGAAWVFGASLSSPNPKAFALRKGILRPNGIGFTPDGQTLFISSCCQLELSKECKQGEGFWYRHHFEIDPEGRPALNPTGVLHVSFGSDKQGCADGFTIIPNPTKPESRNVIIASCPGGLCLLDAEVEENGRSLLGQLKLSFKVSNVAVGGSYIYLTGETKLWRLKLKEHVKSKDEL